MPAMTVARHADDAPGHDGAVAHHLPDDHGEDHGHDDHAHGDEATLGPIDTAAWLAGIAGIAIGLAIAGAFALATSVIG
jgi:ABC-type Zn2+ transport system substrate-binding protein/surface adhesin